MRSSLLRSVLVRSTSFALAVAALGIAPEVARADEPPTTNATIARARASVRSVRSASVESALLTTGVDRIGSGEVVVRFGQAHGGLPVIDRGASVWLDRNGKAKATHVDVEEALPTKLEPSITPAAAALVAARRSIVGARARDAHLVVWPLREGGARLAYAVVPEVPNGLPTAPRIIVDAEDGRVLEVRDMVVFAKARTYLDNPIKTPTLIDEELPIAPDGTTTTLTSAFVTASNCVDKKTVKSLQGLGFPISVHVCELEQRAQADVNGDFLYEPSDVAGADASRSDEFSEVSMYFHTSRAYTFFRGLQGDPEAKVVVDKPLPVIANLHIPAGLSSGNIGAAGDPNRPLEPFSNAFFAPKGEGLGMIFEQLYGMKSGALWFGQGPKRDYAYDGDVVYHELTHAVVDATIKLAFWHVDKLGAVDSPGAMNEALADYFSSAITNDAAMGEYASGDANTSGGVIRTLDNQDKCPNALIGEVHFDSTLFSGALWQARKGLAPAEQTNLDKAVYKALRTNPGRGDVGFEDVANMILTTVTSDAPAAQKAVETAFRDRGILPGCERVLEFKEKPVASPEPRLGFLSPGTQTINARNVAPGLIQVKAALPANTGKVVVTFTARESSSAAGDLLGGGASPFKPLVLAKVGKPISWNPKAKTPHDADAKVVAESDGKVTATLELPEGLEGDTVYVQIANTGESDGAYDGIAIAFVAREPVEPEPAMPTVEPTPQGDGGCGCSVPGGDANTGGVPAIPGAGLTVGLGLVALAVTRRRRT